MTHDRRDPEEAGGAPASEGGWVEPPRTERRFELIATLILSLTAVATAWVGYQASMLGGIQSTRYSDATDTLTEAAQLRTEANEYRLADLGVFENYVDARLQGDEVVASFYEDRFRPEFEVAFDAWMEQDPFNNVEAPASPFLMPDYVLEPEEQADSLDQEAAALKREGSAAGQHSDSYTLATLIFAAVLFFAAIAERFEAFRPRTALLVMAALGFLGGLVVALGQPLA